MAELTGRKLDVVWNDYESYLEIHPPSPFNFEECLVFLNRSSRECLHHIEKGTFYKLLNINNNLVLVTVTAISNKLRISYPENQPAPDTRNQLLQFIIDLFDLDRDLNPFYQEHLEDPILGELLNEYWGLRMVGIPSLFEAITWAIIGQQINLSFAYELKCALVKAYGTRHVIQGREYWLFPSPDTIGALVKGDLYDLKFTNRKSEYIINVARLIAEGELSKSKLLKIRPSEVEASLTEIRGVGPWTANYVMMKCLRYPTAYPFSDVGLKNALKIRLGRKRKPTNEEIRSLGLNWLGWQAYATFYLWRSLYN